MSVKVGVCIAPLNLQSDMFALRGLVHFYKEVVD
jgi:hypothetical protein